MDQVNNFLINTMIHMPLVFMEEWRLKTFAFGAKLFVLNIRLALSSYGNG